MDYDKNKILQMVLILAGICILVWGLTQIHNHNSRTLNDYAQENPEIAYGNTSSQTTDPTESTGTTEPTDATDSQTNAATTDTAESVQSAESTNPTTANPTGNMSVLTGAALNSSLSEEIRTTEQVVYTDGFYYEPLSENLKRYITGISYPDRNSTQGTDSSQSAADVPVITYDDLRYVHIWHYNFEGEPVEGELICNKAIAQDFVEIFYELYRNEYQIEQVLLIDEFDGDDTASMEANNTSCFNYRVVDGSTSLSKHAYGLAIDINPLYNPYITYNKDGTENVSPVSAQAYADRSGNFPYKIDENDLCYRLFKEHGFTWGGNWNSCKDYQHFQKPLPD